MQCIRLGFFFVSIGFINVPFFYLHTKLKQILVYLPSTFMFQTLCRTLCKMPLAVRTPSAHGSFATHSSWNLQVQSYEFLSFWGGGHWCNKFGFDSIYGRSIKFTGLYDDMGDSAWTIKLEVDSLVGDMTDAAGGNEMAKSSSWTVKECWWEGTLEKGMTKQGSTIESKVHEDSLENNSLAENNKLAKCNNWEECNNLKKCNRS